MVSLTSHSFNYGEQTLSVTEEVLQMICRLVLLKHTCPMVCLPDVLCHESMKTLVLWKLVESLSPHGWLLSYVCASLLWHTIILAGKSWIPGLPSIFSVCTRFCLKDGLHCCCPGWPQMYNPVPSASWVLRLHTFSTIPWTSLFSFLCVKLCVFIAHLAHKCDFRDW